ncbi:MAG TPA: ferredoxin [Segeticoccus sp.]|uniref:ferredoxin n=1 Tax=Segeticoccus sp. TaxID=2706531 RepID=UPI002D7EBA84|nr:ferredoxin [Segeticoccus sp.]HET8601016.1 ferredoxin [Segeticoccus sp.]
MAVELTIDWTRCEARGVCLELLPDLIRPDDWGYPMPRHSGLVVPPQVAPDAEAAVRECPRMALRLAMRQ